MSLATFGDISKRDFVVIANALGAIEDSSRRNDEVSRIVPVLRAQNPRFDEQRFKAWVEKVALQHTRTRTRAAERARTRW